MAISLIVATDLNGVIGSNNSMPWPRLKKDMRWFRKHTLGKTIVMGRKTHESIGCTLADRHNIMLTRNPESGCYKGTTMVHNVEGVLRQAAPHAERELVVIGGAQIYDLFLPRVDRIYRTLIHQSYQGDTFLKGIDWDMDWDCIYHEQDEERGIRLDFEIYERPQGSRG